MANEEEGLYLRITEIKFEGIYIWLKNLSKDESWKITCSGTIQEWHTPASRNLPSL